MIVKMMIGLLIVWEITERARRKRVGMKMKEVNKIRMKKEKILKMKMKKIKSKMMKIKMNLIK